MISLVVICFQGISIGQIKVLLNIKNSFCTNTSTFQCPYLHTHDYSSLSHHVWVCYVFTSMFLVTLSAMGGQTEVSKSQNSSTARWKTREGGNRGTSLVSRGAQRTIMTFFSTFNSTRPLPRNQLSPSCPQGQSVLFFLCLWQWGFVHIPLLFPPTSLFSFTL